MAAAQLDTAAHNADEVGDDFRLKNAGIVEMCIRDSAYTKEELAEREKPTLQEQVDANAAAILELAQMLAGGE